MVRNPISNLSVHGTSNLGRVRDSSGRERCRGRHYATSTSRYNWQLLGVVGGGYSVEGGGRCAVTLMQRPRSVENLPFPHVPLQVHPTVMASVCQDPNTSVVLSLLGDVSLSQTCCC